uniref:Bm8082 n=1 Tax=Brugia malayi TaxID=6279 RepID=A0A1I9G9Y3_BRUMA|nr:Bm8082 [Brugia malayi]
MYKDNLTPEQIDSLINLLNDYLSAVIDNIDDVEKAWTILVDLMFSSVRDGFYQELRRQRRQSPTHLKSSRESSASTERLLENSESNLRDSVKLGANSRLARFRIHF